MERAWSFYLSYGFHNYADVMNELIWFPELMVFPLQKQWNFFFFSFFFLVWPSLARKGCQYVRSLITWTWVQVTYPHFNIGCQIHEVFNSIHKVTPNIHNIVYSFIVLLHVRAHAPVYFSYVCIICNWLSVLYIKES